jgi:HNH endonuclease
MIVNLPSKGQKGFQPIPWRERFWTKVIKSENCWEWQGVKNGDGYGQFKRDGQMVPAHRIAFELIHGEIPNGLYVLHQCDNPPCVKPSHLYLGTQFDNMRDMFQKGRDNPGGRKW